MSSSNIIRWGAASFAVGGVVWIVLNLVTLGDDLTAVPGPFPLSLYILALLLTAVGIAGFHALQKGSYGRLGRAGFYAILASTAVLILSALSLLAEGGESGQILYLTGLLGTLIGYGLFGVATFRAGVLPRWCGVLFVLLLPVSVALVVYGNIFAGFAQLALSYVLWSRREAATERQPARVI